MSFPKAATAAREAQLVVFLADYQTENGRSASLDDIVATGIYASKGSAGPALDRLARQGRIVRSEGHRGIVLMGHCPTCGREVSHE